MNKNGADRLSDTSPALGLDEREARAAFVLRLRSSGIGDRNVLAAIERVPRRLFLAAIYHALAYQDAVVPIECGQTASAPSLVARVVQALCIEPNHRVLEVGTGSGYQTAVLSHLAAEVHSIERYRGLVDLARQRLAALKLKNIHLHHGDGLAPTRAVEDTIGLADAGADPERALEDCLAVRPLKATDKFDRIVVNAAWPVVPDDLRGLLKPNGILILPLGAPREIQKLTRYTVWPGAEVMADGHVRVTTGVEDVELLDHVRTVSLVRGTAAVL
ncbi:rRNA adenine N-6-methyltransferase family protein [Roseibium aestuarii]|uniref:Protein-L-isoaspartate O-methyltransferase n=1 Tax=Roseibium aestuarii TaxID=2600299 RepID=A0ABW4JSB1_9HYPH|nr:rRNA adenine N-6-methyltransferase family protein [Roseibium aestuarii]